MQKQVSQGVVGCFTFGAKDNKLQMVDYYWAKQHSNYQVKEIASTKTNSQREDDLKDDKDIQDCLNHKRAPDYLNNITGICFPYGLPAAKHVKFSINQDSC